jgi:hypothetical protein
VSCDWKNNENSFQPVWSSGKDRRLMSMRLKIQVPPKEKGLRNQSGLHKHYWHFLAQRLYHKPSLKVSCEEALMCHFRSIFIHGEEDTPLLLLSTNCRIGCFSSKAIIFLWIKDQLCRGLMTVQAEDLLPMYRDFPGQL